LNKDLKVDKPITDYFKSNNLFSKALFEERLVKWIVKDDQSFQVVENESFKDMMSLVRPGLGIPSRYTVKRKILDEFQDKRVEIIDLFDKLDSKVSCLKSWSK
jgi:acyl-ACP thioesterase